ADAPLLCDLRRRVSEAHSVRDRRAPSVEEIGAEGDDQLRVAKVPPRPRHAVRAAMCLDRGMIRLEIDAQMRPYTVRGEPAVEERRETPTLVLVEEDRGARGARGAPATGLAELLRQQRDRLVPRRRAPRAASLDHRRAESVGIVEALERGLSARAERAAIQWVLGISLEL